MFHKLLLTTACLCVITPLIPEETAYSANLTSNTSVDAQYLMSNMQDNLVPEEAQASDAEDSGGLSDLALGGIIGAASLVGGIAAAAAFKKRAKIKTAVVSAGSTLAQAGRTVGRAGSSGLSATGRAIAAPFKALKQKASAFSARISAWKEARTVAKTRELAPKLVPAPDDTPTQPQSLRTTAGVPPADDATQTAKPKISRLQAATLKKITGKAVKKIREKGNATFAAGMQETFGPQESDFEDAASTTPKRQPTSPDPADDATQAAKPKISPDAQSTTRKGLLADAATLRFASIADKTPPATEPPTSLDVAQGETLTTEEAAAKRSQLGARLEQRTKERIAAAEKRREEEAAAKKRREEKAATAAEEKTKITKNRRKKAKEKATALKKLTTNAATTIQALARSRQARRQVDNLRKVLTTTNTLRSFATTKKAQRETAMNTFATKLKARVEQKKLTTTAATRIQALARGRQARFEATKLRAQRQLEAKEAQDALDAQRKREAQKALDAQRQLEAQKTLDAQRQLEAQKTLDAQRQLEAQKALKAKTTPLDPSAPVDKTVRSKPSTPQLDLTQVRAQDATPPTRTTSPKKTEERISVVYASTKAQAAVPRPSDRAESARSLPTPPLKKTPQAKKALAARSAPVTPTGRAGSTSGGSLSARGPEATKSRSPATSPRTPRHIAPTESSLAKVTPRSARQRPQKTPRT